MTWLLDIIIALIIGVSIFLGAKNGFVKTAIGAAAFIIAVAVTCMFTSPLAGALKGTGIGKGIESATEEFISDIMLDNSMDMGELINGESEEFNNFVNISGTDNQELKDWYSQQENSAEETAKSALAKKLANPIADLITKLLAVIILFFGTRILLSVASYIITKICKLPVLNTCNTLLGVILGVILAIIRVALFCFIMNTLIKNADYLGVGWISDLNPDGTLLFNMFRNINIFSFFI
ncbi:MAG: CvpA family protein [Clostridia bacterium]|nr:CvpA family protein [Clostridia bacterium]